MRIVTTMIFGGLQMLLAYLLLRVGPFRPMTREHLSWRVLVTSYAALKILAVLLMYSRPAGAAWISIGADTLLNLLASRDDDWWKKRWGKIQGAGLTAVNAARFNQQVKEACS